MSPMESCNIPLVVDLDGTLIRTDLLMETASQYLTRHPLKLVSLLHWLVLGRSELKMRLAGAVSIDAATLPYHEQLLSWLRAEKERGRWIVLATASHRSLADKVAVHLGIFDEVLASTDNVNLKSAAKRDALIDRFGIGGFDYVGNDWSDREVWQAASRAHVVSSSRRLIGMVRKLGNMGQIMGDGRPPVYRSLLRTIRPHQWMKNLLVFLPLLASHQYSHLPSMMASMLAFTVFSLTASSVYVLNDLVDVTDDRHHQRKRHRPLAAGNLSLLVGWIAWPSLLCLALILVLTWPTGELPWRFLAWMVVYFFMTLAYSLRLKQTPILDVIILAVLYTLRLIAGAAAIGVPMSFWLLSFSMFLFLSLAFIKRYSELKVARGAGRDGPLRGRGYDPQDFELVASLGGSAGYTAVLVLALYIQDTRTASLYSSPAYIWLACPLLLFWISRAWLIAHRGHMHDDPIVFALKDRISWGVAAMFGLVFVAARMLA